MNNRDALIQGLAKEFAGDKYDDLHMDSVNYIEETGSLDCTAFSISEDSLNKTLNVIKQHEAKFSKDALTNRQAKQYSMHLKIARKCVEEIILEKRKH